MLVRIVKMHFKVDRVEDFIAQFAYMRPRILAQEGCTFVELLQDAKDPTIFFTYSYWASEEDLNRYRYTELFQNTWKRVKTWFSDKPEAWSVERVFAEFKGMEDPLELSDKH